jgi:hypothetical protein
VDLCYDLQMPTLVEKFLSGAGKLGARPRQTRSAVFFDRLTLEIMPSIDDEEPKSIELVWPAEEPRYEEYAALLYRLLLGSECNSDDFLKGASLSMEGGCGYSESHGKWAVRMFSRRGVFHLSFVDMSCVRNKGHCSSHLT